MDSSDFDPLLDYSTVKVPEETECYFCGPPRMAVKRLKPGHPVCERCLNEYKSKQD